MVKDALLDFWSDPYHTTLKAIIRPQLVDMCLAHIMKDWILNNFSSILWEVVKDYLILQSKLLVLDTSKESSSNRSKIWLLNMMALCEIHARIFYNIYMERMVFLHNSSKDTIAQALNFHQKYSDKSINGNNNNWKRISDIMPPKFRPFKNSTFTYKRIGKCSGDTFQAILNAKIIHIFVP